MSMLIFLVKRLAEKWKVELKDKDFEWAHRLGPVRDSSKYSRAVIFKLHHYQKRLHIWRETRRQQEDGNPRVVPDMSGVQREKRKAFWPLREQLHQQGVKTFLKYPATMHVEDGEQVKQVFTSPEKAKLELQKKYPSIK